ncbi:MAG: hypothetical protein ACR2GY_06225 [Phycisphaerales bacterium]
MDDTTTEPSDWQRRGLWERDPNAYMDLLPNEWSHPFVALTKQCPLLNHPSMDLLAEWRGIIYSLQMIVTIPIGVQSCIETMAKHDPLNWSAPTLDSVRAAYHDSPVYQIGLVSIIRIVHAGLYGAYENYLREVLSQRDAPGSRSMGKFARSLDSAFGRGTWDTFYKSTDIERIRIIRNELLHNRGRQGKDLYPKFYEEMGGVVQITASTLRRDFGVLKASAFSFARHVVEGGKKGD